MQLKWLALLGPLLVLSACFGGAGKSAVVAEEVSLVAPEPGEHETKLQRRVRNDLTSAKNDEAEGRSRVIGRKPYFLKQFSVYPEGAETFDVKYLEMESRTAPLSAEVVARKLLFSTRLHRDRETARADSHFLRDTGIETTTYELRNGKWQRVGSLFIAEKTEQQVGGEWRPVQKQTPPALSTESEDRGFWNRLRFWQ